MCYSILGAGGERKCGDDHQGASPVAKWFVVYVFDQGTLLLATMLSGDGFMVNKG